MGGDLCDGAPCGSISRVPARTERHLNDPLLSLRPGADSLAASQEGSAPQSSPRIIKVSLLQPLPLPWYRASQAEGRGFDPRLPLQHPTRRRDRAAAGAPDAPPLADHLLSEQDDGAPRRRPPTTPPRRPPRTPRAAPPPAAPGSAPARRHTALPTAVRYQRYRMVRGALGSGSGR